MEKGDSFENSWADQWDNDHQLDPVAVGHNNKSGSSSGAKYSKKFGESFKKTKAAASMGMKKVKGEASVGMNWVKLKVQYQKRSNHKKDRSSQDI